MGISILMLNLLFLPILVIVIVLAVSIYFATRKGVVDGLKEYNSKPSNSLDKPQSVVTQETTQETTKETTKEIKEEGVIQAKTNIPESHKRDVVSEDLVESTEEETAKDITEEIAKEAEEFKNIDVKIPEDSNNSKPAPKKTATKKTTKKSTASKVKELANETEEAKKPKKTSTKKTTKKVQEDSKKLEDVMVGADGIASPEVIFNPKKEEK